MEKKQILLFTAVTLTLVLIFFPNFSRYRKLLSQQRELEERIRELEKENRRLEEEKYKLEHDIEYVEKRAREKLGIVKEDEIPYRIIEERE